MKNDARLEQAYGRPPRDQSRAIYFASGERTLFGWLHHGAPGSRGLVLCNPFGHEAICAHRALRLMAEQASAAGIPALRFDYSGTGDSDDIDPSADQVELWVRDILAAIEELKRCTGVRHVCLLGVRLGGLLATLAAHRSPVESLILIGPTLSGRRYLREFKTARLVAALRREGGEAGEADDSQAMEVAGFTISRATVRSLATVDLASLRELPVRHALVLDALGSAAAADWAAALSPASVELDYRAVAGPVEMVMTAPQFGMRCPEVVAAVREWLLQLPPHPSEPARGRIVPPPGGADALDRLQGSRGWQSESPVFINGSALLFGVLTQPRVGESRRRAVVLLNAAADYHIGPGRIYVSLARGWAKHGYFVLRLDLAGLGDSVTRAGEPDDVVFTRAALDDIRAAIQFLKVRHGVRDVTLAGLCSGAYHALRAAMEGLPVNRILMVNPLNFFWDKDMERSELRLAEVVRVPSRYRERLFSFRHWTLLLSGRVSIGRIALIYLQRAMLALESTARDLLRALHIRLPHDLGWELERIAARGVSMVFVFARGEPGIELLKLQAGSALRRLGPRCRIHVIDSGDHIFGRSGPRSILASILSEELFAPSSRLAPQASSRLTDIRS